MAPDSSTTVVVKDSTGTAMTVGAVSIVSSKAVATLTPAATLVLGTGYDVYWTPDFTSVRYQVVRQTAVMCEFVPPAVISEADLVGGEGIPELAYRVPFAQGASGSAVGWQPQVDAAYYAFLREFTNNGRKLWLIRDASGYREWCLAKALLLAVRSIPDDPDGQWATKARELRLELADAAGRVQIQFSDDAPGVRRSGSPTTQLAPVGRPWW